MMLVEKVIRIVNTFQLPKRMKMRKKPQLLDLKQKFIDASIAATGNKTMTMQVIREFQDM